MAKPKGGLGRGLSSLIPTEEASAAAAPPPRDGLHDIPVANISTNQYQPREHFDEGELNSLAASIKELGVLQPILVRRTPGGFELIAGERRWRAAQRAGLATIPAVVRDVEDQGALEQAIVENLHRADLNAIEEAHAYQQLIDEFALTQDQVASRVGKSRSAVTNTLRLLQLHPSIQHMVIGSEISAGHARAILGAEPGDQIDLADRVVEEQLSVRALEELLRSPPPPDPVKPSTRSNIGHTRSAGILELERLLGDHFETRVSIDAGVKRSRLVIEFADEEDLHRVAGLILPTD